MDPVRNFQCLSLSAKVCSVLLVLLSCLAVLGNASVRGGRPCREPSEAMDLLQSEAELNTQLYNTETFSSTSGVTVKTLNHNGCSSTSNGVCVCHTHQKAIFDDARIPKVLVQTSCCHANPRSVAGWRTFCRNVTHSVQVFRRTGCVNGVYQYRSTFEDIPVGCSCSSSQW